MEINLLDIIVKFGMDVMAMEILSIVAFIFIYYVQMSLLAKVK